MKGLGDIMDKLVCIMKSVNDMDKMWYSMRNLEDIMKILVYIIGNRSRK